MSKAEKPVETRVVGLRCASCLSNAVVRLGPNRFRCENCGTRGARRR